MRERTPEIINHGQGGQDKIGNYLTVQGSGAQDNTSMRRQLQASFSQLEDFEAEFKVKKANANIRKKSFFLSENASITKKILFIRMRFKNSHRLSRIQLKRK